MRIAAEMEITPGDAVMFVTEVRVEYFSDDTTHWVAVAGWWLYEPKRWRQMLWKWDFESNSHYTLWTMRLLGFELSWTYQPWRTANEV